MATLSWGPVPFIWEHFLAPKGRDRGFAYDSEAFSTGGFYQRRALFSPVVKEDFVAEGLCAFILSPLCPSSLSRIRLCAIELSINPHPEFVFTLSVKATPFNRGFMNNIRDYAVQKKTDSWDWFTQMEHDREEVRKISLYYSCKAEFLNVTEPDMPFTGADPYGNTLVRLFEPEACTIEPTA